MATKKVKQLKTAKRVIKTKAEDPSIEVEVIKPSEDELILGAKEEVKKTKVVDYLSEKQYYMVTVSANQRTIKVNGREIGTFIGQNEKVRKLLKEGGKSATIHDSKDRELYKIEVL